MTTALTTADGSPDGPPRAGNERAGTARAGTADAPHPPPPVRVRPAAEAPAARAAGPADPLRDQIDSWLVARGDELVTVRRHLHAHPELSHAEFETAALVARELAVAGLTPRLLPKGNGVICDIGTGDRVVALRADLDALPLQDVKEVPYASTVANVTHACGHDVHTTVMLGVAQVLARIAESGGLPGRVRMLFQPAEECIPSGAPDVIAAGALEGVSAVYALHCAPQLTVGTVGVRSGPFTAAADTVEVTLRGKGGHTARPHVTADLVGALGRVIVDVPALLGRRVDPRAGLSLVWGTVRAGEAFNAIPGVGVVRGTLRVLGREAWRGAPQLVEELVEAAIAGTGARASINYVRGVPPVINDHRANAVVAGAAGAVLGAERVVEAEVSMGGEDFSFYLEHVPGAMIRLGTAPPGSEGVLDIHQPGFDVDERAIGVGVRVMVRTAVAALRGPA